MHGRHYGLILCLCSLALVSARGERKDTFATREDQQGFLFASQDPRLVLNLDVMVGLVGFTGDGHLQAQMDSQRFQDSLVDYLPVIRPHCATTGAELAVEYRPHVSVKAFADRARMLEGLIVAHAKFVNLDSEGMSVFDISAQGMEAQLGLIIGWQAKTKQHGVVLLNPDKARLASMLGVRGGKLSYRYRYDGGSPCASWISARSFVVVDLSAGPMVYGPTGAGDGTVGASSIPTITVEEDKGITESSLAQLSAVVLSAVRHVFAPDVDCNGQYADKVVVPIVVLRNHRRFNPLVAQGTKAEFKIDVPLIREQLESLLLPGQELLLLPVLEDLHAHPFLSTAVFKALKGDTVHTASQEGYKTRTMAYLDSKILAEEMRHGADALTAMLIESTMSDPDAGFVHEDVVGLRIYPVFVFSLLGHAPELLFDMEGLSKSYPWAAVALQTGADSILLPFTGPEGQVTSSPRAITRHIIAALASGLFGVQPSYAATGKSVTQDFRWATGALPFGPFTASKRLSTVYADNACVSSIVTRASRALHSVRAALQELRLFTEEFQSGPHELSREAPPDGNELREETEQLQRSLSLWHTSQHAHGVVAKLTEQAWQVEMELLELSSLLWRGDFVEANELCGSIHVSALAFADYIKHEIERSRTELACCSKRFIVRRPFSSWRAYGWAVVLALFFALCAGTLAYMVRFAEHPLLRWRAKAHAYTI